MMEFIDEIAKALQSDQPLSYADAKRYHEQLSTRRIEVERRFAAIRPAKGPASTGRERLRVMQSGTADEIEAITDEAEALAIERERIAFQLRQLTDVREKAKGREAAEAMPETLATLRSNLEAVIAAQHALADAWQTAQATLDEIKDGRTTASAHGYGVEGADDGLMQLIGKASQGPADASVQLPRWAKTEPSLLKESLGYEASSAAA